MDDGVEVVERKMRVMGGGGQLKMGDMRNKVGYIQIREEENRWLG